MKPEAAKNARAFKTAWFSKAARKAHIPDRELCAAFEQVLIGQADDLGGGVYKKRLGRNLYRSIILAKSGERWVFEYLFAKQDRANIEDDQLVRLRRLAKAYEDLTEKQFNELLKMGAWEEICR